VPEGSLPEFVEKRPIKLEVQLDELGREAAVHRQNMTLAVVAIGVISVVALILHFV
jgi:hypothetical protein